jgi:Xaa-Pro dipeptidase
MSNIMGDQIGIPFTEEEYQSRLKRVRNLMEKKGIDLLMLREPINIHYLTGYNTIGFGNHEILFIPLEGDITLLVRFLERQITFSTSWIKDVVTWEDHEDPFVVTRDLVFSKGWNTKRVAFEESNKYMSVNEYKAFSSAMGIELIDGSGIVEEVRKIKSPAEVEYIRKAGTFTAAALKAGMEALAAGKTENDIVAEVSKAMIAAGSEYPSDFPILTGGWKSGVPHTTFNRLMLQEGDAVLFELGGVYNRYTAAMMRSAVIGKFDPEIKVMYDVCVEALEAAIDAIKPGVTSGEVDEACRSVIEKAGYYENFRKRTGYSIGCAYPPSWVEGHIIDLKKDDPRVLEPGMVFHMPPALRKYDKFGVGVSETVLVTQTGCEVLTCFPRELFIAK